MNEVVLKDFWKIVEQFPDIHNLSDLTKIIVSIENGSARTEYPRALSFLKEFESIMRCHIYEEQHVVQDEFSLISGYEINWN